MELGCSIGLNLHNESGSIVVKRCSPRDIAHHVNYSGLSPRARELPWNAKLVVNNSLPATRVAGYRECRPHKLMVGAELHGKRGLVAVERCSKGRCLPCNCDRRVSLPATGSELLGEITTRHRGGEERWAWAMNLSAVSCLHRSPLAADGGVLSQVLDVARSPMVGGASVGERKCQRTIVVSPTHRCLVCGTLGLHSTLHSVHSSHAGR